MTWSAFELVGTLRFQPFLETGNWVLSAQCCANNFSPLTPVSNCVVSLVYWKLNTFSPTGDWSCNSEWMDRWLVGRLAPQQARLSHWAYYYYEGTCGYTPTC